MAKSKEFKDVQENVEAEIILSASETSPSDLPDYECSAYEKQLGAVELVRHVYGGTDSMREQGKTYLPKHAQEKEQDWEDRRRRSVLFNALSRTNRGLVGMVFRKDPILGDDVPERVDQDMEDVDLGGRALSVFAKDVFTAAMLDGHSLIHVEFPQVGEEVRNRAEERAAGVRPYWVHVLKQDLINFRWEMQEGKPVLTLGVYRESITEEAGRFGERSVTRYRVLRPGEFEVWERRQDKAEGSEQTRVSFARIDAGVTSLHYVPLYPVYTNRLDPFVSEPPLLDLAYENIRHWQLRSDRDESITMGLIPILFGKGIDPDKVVIGPHHGIYSESTEADMKWLEVQGTAYEESRKELKDIEARMAALGLSMLVRETRAAETAEAKIIDKSESDSALATAARGLQDGLESALQAHADYLKADSGGSVAVNRDFHDQVLDPAMIKVLSREVQMGHISLDTMWDILQSGEVLPEDFDRDLERDRLETQDITALEAAIRAGRE